MQRARQSAQELGFDPGLAEHVLESLIEAAVATQVASQPMTHKGELQRILIVGGAGRMGAWLRQFLEGQGHTVASCDPQGGEFADLSLARSQNWDVVVLSASCSPTTSCPWPCCPRPLDRCWSCPATP